MRDPGEVVKNVERRRDELAELIPEIRQPEVRRVNEINNRCDGDPDSRPARHWIALTWL